MDGILRKAARQMRKNLPVVYISGFGPYPVRSIPGAAYVHKPFNQADLRVALESVLFKESCGAA
jgi:hypothetical protein